MILSPMASSTSPSPSGVITRCPFKNKCSSISFFSCCISTPLRDPFRLCFADFLTFNFTHFFIESFALFYFLAEIFRQYRLSFGFLYLNKRVFYIIVLLAHALDLAFIPGAADSAVGKVVYILQITRVSRQHTRREVGLDAVQRRFEHLKMRYFARH